MQPDIVTGDVFGEAEEHPVTKCKTCHSQFYKKAFIEIIMFFISGFQVNHRFVTKIGQEFCEFAKLKFFIFKRNLKGFSGKIDLRIFNAFIDIMQAFQ